MSMFFLMCSERSGSNLTTKIMNAHSNICGPSTKHIINPVARNLFRYEPLSKKENWRELVKDIHTLISVNFSLWKKSFSLDDLLKLAPAGDIVSLIRNIFYAEAKENDKQYVFIKENHIYEFLPFLLIHYPEAKYLYQVRDPRDMALSWKENSIHPGGVVKAARQWQKDQQNSLKIYNELSKKGSSIMLAYEDLISDMEYNIKNVMNFFGVPYEENMKNFYQDELTISNSKKQKAWENLSKEVIKDNKNKYLKSLSENEIKAIEKICYYEMFYLGYKPEFSKTELDKYDNNMLELLDREETLSITHTESEGVAKNKAAKAVFYRKII